MKCENNMRVLWVGKAVGVNQWKQPTIRNGKPATRNSKSYTAYKQGLAMFIRSRGIKMRSGYYDLYVEATLWKMSDTDGVIKGLLDALELSGIVKNDRYIRNIYIQRFYHKRGELDQLSIRLERAGPDELPEMMMSEI